MQSLGVFCIFFSPKHYKENNCCSSLRPNFLPRAPPGLCARSAAGTAGTLDGAGRSGAGGRCSRRGCTASRARVQAGGKDARRLLAGPRGAPTPSPRPRSSLPDGGRFLLSRLTARLNISAGAGVRKEEQPGRAAAEPEEGEEEEEAVE